MFLSFACENCIHISGPTIGQAWRMRLYRIQIQHRARSCFVSWRWCHWFQSDRSHSYNMPPPISSRSPINQIAEKCGREIAQQSNQKTKKKNFSFAFHFSMRITRLRVSNKRCNFLYILWQVLLLFPLKETVYNWNGTLTRFEFATWNIIYVCSLFVSDRQEDVRGGVIY